jgi:hypothetical protein
LKFSDFFSNQIQENLTPRNLGQIWNLWKKLIASLGLPGPRIRIIYLGNQTQPKKLSDQSPTSKPFLLSKMTAQWLAVKGNNPILTLDPTVSQVFYYPKLSRVSLQQSSLTKTLTPQSVGGSFGGS